MKQLVTSFFMVICIIAGSVDTAYAGWDANAVHEARQSVLKFKRKDPKLKAFFERAYGYAVFPTVGKGGIGIGGGLRTGGVLLSGVGGGSPHVGGVPPGFFVGGAG